MSQGQKKLSKLKVVKHSESHQTARSRGGTRGFVLILVMVVFRCAPGSEAVLPEAQPLGVPGPLPVEEWRRRAPKSQVRTRSEQTTQFHRFDLANGLMALVLDPALVRVPVGVVMLLTRGGAAMDPAYGEGQTYMTHARLRLGGGEYKGSELFQKIQLLRAHLSVSIGRDFGEVVLSASEEHVERLLNLLNAMIRRPSDNEDVFLDLKKAHIRQIRTEVLNPQLEASRRIEQEVFGYGHPYARPLLGEPRSLERLRWPKILRHHRKIFNPDLSAVVVMSSQPLDKTESWIRSIFRRWRSRLPRRGSYASMMPRLPAVPKLAANTGPVVLHQEDMEQAIVCVGGSLPGREHKDAEALVIANILLGGQFNSRLQSKIREEGNYSYGAQSSIEWHYKQSLFSACARVEANQAKRAIDDMFSEIRGLATRLPTDTEVRASYERLKTQRWLSLQTVAGARRAAIEEFLNAPITRLVKRVQAPSPENVRSVIRRYFANWSGHVVIAGDSKKIMSTSVAVGEL